jgi:FkbM family methyltransferase
MLALHKRAAAFVMRRLPVRIRRFRSLRYKMYAALGAASWEENDAIDSRWPKKPQSVRANNGMRLVLDLTDWSQRWIYFSGGFYQEELEGLISRLLRPGDNFVDVGANIGVITLHAASIVGNSFWSFEPNPEVFLRLSYHVGLNGLDGRVFNMGLGSSDGILPLAQSGRHTGKATLVSRGDEAAKMVDVQIRRGDEVLADLGTLKPTLIKIDVEGFEVSVLEGLGTILDGNVAVVIEVSPHWLQRAGSSAKRLFAILQSHGLEPYSFETIQGRTSCLLAVEPLNNIPDDEQYDCLFMRAGSVFAQRAASRP